MPQIITFEPFTVRHLNACAEIAASAPDPWSAADVAAELKHPGRAGFVAIGKEGPVGVVFFKIEDENAVLLQIAVAPASREAGVGTALLQHAAQALPSYDIENIVLEVRAGNTPALALYQKLGFEEIACRPSLYTHPTEDGFTMQKKL